MLASTLETSLLSFHENVRALPGILDAPTRAAFVEQLLESVHRVKYVSTIRGRPISERRADPNDDLFDPLKAAMLHQERGNLEEAFWLVFLFVHFGKNRLGGWRYAREVYGRLGGALRWDWASVSSDIPGFRLWLDNNQGQLKRPGVPGGFGNHRKYESLDANSSRGTGAAIESYVNWVGPPRTHEQLMTAAYQQAGGDRRVTFDLLYRSMADVVRFGRTARFDYLAMIGKMGLASIEPGSSYMGSSTGPAAGARLLFNDDSDAAISAKHLDQWLVDLDGSLHVGMQVLEDALCNWQKSPSQFVPFRE
jgi:hypothetical protein